MLIRSFLSNESLLQEELWDFVTYLLTIKISRVKRTNKARIKKLMDFLTLYSKGLISRFSQLTFDGSSQSRFSLSLYFPWNKCFSGQTFLKQQLQSFFFSNWIYVCSIFKTSSNFEKITKAPRVGTSSIDFILFFLKNESSFSLLSYWSIYALID